MPLVTSYMNTSPIVLYFCVDLTKDFFLAGFCKYNLDFLVVITFDSVNELFIGLLFHLPSLLEVMNF